MTFVGSPIKLTLWHHCHHWSLWDHSSQWHHWSLWDRWFSGDDKQVWNYWLYVTDSDPSDRTHHADINNIPDITYSTGITDLYKLYHWSQWHHQFHWHQCRDVMFFVQAVKTLTKHQRGSSPVMWEPVDDRQGRYTSVLFGRVLWFRVTLVSPVD